MKGAFIPIAGLDQPVSFKLHKQVSPSELWIPLVVAEAEQVERTRTKTWSRGRSEVFVPYTPPPGASPADVRRPL